MVGGGAEEGGGGAGGYRESKASDSYTASPLNATTGPGYNLLLQQQAFQLQLVPAEQVKLLVVLLVNGNPPNNNIHCGGRGGGQNNPLDGQPRIGGRSR